MSRSLTHYDAVGSIVHDGGPTNLTATDPDGWVEIVGTAPSAAGIRVSHTSALEFPAVMQAISILSGDVALSTLDVYKRQSNGDRDVDRDHPAEYLVSTEWNPYTPAYEGWKRVQSHIELWGNGYVFIDRDGPSMPPKGLYNLLPDRTKPEWTSDRELFYVTEVRHPNGYVELVPLLKEQVLHFKGVTLDVALGCDMIRKTRDMIGLGLAAQNFLSKFFMNGAQSGGVLMIPPGFTKDAAAKLEEGWTKKYENPDNWFKTAILRDGAKFESVTIDPQQSEMNLLREEQVRDVARSFNLPPFKLGLTDSVSYNSQEQSQLIYVTGTLAHRFAAIASECNCKLLTVPQKRRQTHFFEHNRTKLIEVDVKTMSEVLEIERRNEIISGNEWRKKINLPRVNDPRMDEYYNPNTTTNERPSEEPPDEPEQDDAHAVEALQHVLNRMVSKVCNDIDRHSKNPADLLAWVDSHGLEHRDLLTKDAKPVFRLWKGPAGDRSLDVLVGDVLYEIRSAVAPYLEPPHVATELESNVKNETTKLRAMLPATLAARAAGVPT